MKLTENLTEEAKKLAALVMAGAFVPAALLQDVTTQALLAIDEPTREMLLGNGKRASQCWPWGCFWV